MSSPIGGKLEVVPEELRRFGAALATGAEQISALEVASPFEAAAGALPGSEVSAALGRAPVLAKSTFDAVSARLRGLSEVARGNARSYEVVDSWRVGEGEG